MTDTALFGPTEFLPAAQLLLPPGRAWRTDPGAVMTQLQRALADTAAAVHARAADLSERESDPTRAIELLPEWEAVFGLPDPCTPLSPTLQQRWAAIRAKLAAQGDGSQSRQSFIAIAAALGFPITITEFRPFRAGESAVETALYDDPSWIHTWQVNTASVTETDFKVELSTVGEPLAVWDYGPLTCVLRQLNPGGKILVFALAPGGDTPVFGDWFLGDSPIG